MDFPGLNAIKCVGLDNSGRLNDEEIVIALGLPSYCNNFLSSLLLGLKMNVNKKNEIVENELTEKYKNKTTSFCFIFISGKAHPCQSYKSDQALRLVPVPIPQIKTN